MGVTIEFVLPEEIVALVLAFSLLPESAQDEILEIIGGMKGESEAKPGK